jgi:hypothetical protein
MHTQSKANYRPDISFTQGTEKSAPFRHSAIEFILPISEFGLKSCLFLGGINYMIRYTYLACTAVALCLSAPALAQDDATGESVAEATAETTAEEVMAMAEPAVAAAPEATKPCELHVWPTENYLGIKMGLLSGFGLVGALADQGVNKKKVTSIKDLMREYLGPEVQLQELEKLNYLEKLKLSPDEYSVIMHEPTPWNEDLKDNPELKAKTKATNKKIKNGERISDSTNPCYAELITTHIFYHKAMMYGSNLFTGWVFNKYDGNKRTLTGTGQVKNPLENFPPKDESMVEAAKEELRTAYSLDFAEWAEKKSGVYGQ